MQNQPPVSTLSTHWSLSSTAREMRTQTASRSAQSALCTHAHLIARAKRRRDQRGAAVLIVFLVLMMLAGVGAYAAHSSTVSTAVAGSSKQLSQTRYVTEYAVMNAMAALARDPQRYVNQMPQYAPAANDPKCYGFALVPNATCYPMGIKQLEDEAGTPLIVPADSVANIPGGLGPASIEADFNIDLTDLMPASPPVPGEALNAESPVKLGYLAVTLTAIGQLRPVVDPSDTAAVAKELAASASVQAWRAHVVVGPLTNPAPRPLTP
ncbi:MAG: hypothetical protein IPK82_25650 [Polyangiaceae bacterium]|nr:hypothetical protein [Polyangiaceae bacterium]